jgi:hypothetical protein
MLLFGEKICNDFEKIMILPSKLSWLVKRFSNTVMVKEDEYLQDTPTLMLVFV